jgi:4-hydroxy-3-methylbut-2-en-1-yl diphosphate synthase IspG/GcpE
MKKLIARLQCYATGHLRGKLVSKDQTHKFYACPRCGRQTSYAIKKAP